MANETVNHLEQKSDLQLFDLLSAKSSKLSAMISLIGGEGQERFDSMNDEVRSNYIWACDDFAQEIEALVSRLGSLLFSRGSDSVAASDIAPSSAL